MSNYNRKFVNSIIELFIGTEGLERRGSPLYLLNTEDTAYFLG